MEKKSSVNPAKSESSQADRTRNLRRCDVAGHVFADRVFEIEVDGLAGVATEVLKPGVTRAPCDDQERGDEEAPGEEPDEVREPVHDERHFVVVVAGSGRR